MVESLQRTDQNGLSIEYRGLCDMVVRLAEHFKSKRGQSNSACLGSYNCTVAKLAKSDLKAAYYAEVRSRTKCVEEGGSCSPNVFRLGRTWR